MPPFQPLASSAATSAVGTRKTTAGMTKSIIDARPYGAMAGSPRMLATAQVVSKAMVTQDNLTSLFPLTAGFLSPLIDETPALNDNRL